jgi:hypothetical protein
MRIGTLLLVLAGLAACSGSDPAPADIGDRVAPAQPLEPGGNLDAEAFVVFTEPGTGFMTTEVHDADREVVHFHAELAAMVSALNGTSVDGWDANGTDLSWSRSGISFRVRFGTEEGERRAYFTEAGPGTICNLRILGTDQLSISGTSETPPNP